MSTPAFGCPFCSAIFAEEDQMLCHFLQESSNQGCGQQEGRRSNNTNPDFYKPSQKETVHVEVGDDPSKAKVIASDDSKEGPYKAVKDEIIIEECDDDDEAPDGDNSEKTEELVCQPELPCVEEELGCSLARSAGANIRVPPIKRANKIEYKKMVEELADMKTISYILPVSQMQSILYYLLVHSDMVVETDVGNFDLHRTRYMDFLHQLHLNRTQIREEDEWFGEKLMMPFQCEEGIDMESVYRFHEVIQDNSCSVTVGLPSCTALVSDLMSLPCDRWLTDGLLDCFAHIVRQVAIWPTEVFNVTELADVSEVCAVLEERYPDREGLQVIFLLHVGKADHEVAHTSPNDRPYTASHFSFALYTFDQNEVIYADTLGWSVPEPLYFMMNEFIAHFRLPEPTYSCLHDPESVVNGESHVCSSRCSRLYPVEQADSAYGLAVVTGFCLAAVDKDAFRLLTANTEEVMHPNKLDYLQDVTQYSKFLRLVLITWLMQGDINVAMLYQAPRGSPSGRATRLSQRRRKKKVPFGATPENSPEREVASVGGSHGTRGGGSRVSTPPDSLNFENVNDLVTKAPEVGFLKNYGCLRVRFYLKNGKIVTKRFKCNSTGKKDIRALKKVQDYVDRKDVHVYLKQQSGILPNHKKNWLQSSNEAVNAILLKTELVTQGAGSLRLRCTLTNGVTKSKIYSGEKDDPKIRSEVLEFLSSRMCEEWLKEEKKWVYLEEVNPGPDTRTYIDCIPFDVKKKCIKVDRRVKPVSDAGTLSVSVEANPNWGKLHRYDETYVMKDKKFHPRDRFIGVTMILQCASLTSECRADCGGTLKSITTHGKICSGCQLNMDSGRTCEGCFTTDSPHWYSNDTAATLCNACYRANGRRKTQRRKDKIHHPHLKCKWKLKFELDQNLKTWKVYKGAANEFYHHKEPQGERKRPTWAERDVWDKARILSNATAHEIYNSMQRGAPLIPASDPTVTQALGQITRRCKSIDKKYLHLAMNWRKDPNPTCSDWRKAEKVLENNYENVIHYQRGDKLLNRDYRIILATDANLLALRDLGREVIGIDSKEDFMNGCFKTLYVTYYDQAGQEEVAVSAVCNRETEDTYSLVFQMIAANIPCRNPSCTHPKVLHIYNDENGFFWVRPCSSKAEFRPLVQHENKSELRNAVTFMLWFSSLYNFNTLETVKAHISSIDGLQLLQAPIELGFKCVLLGWNNEMRKRLEHSYKEFLMNVVPDALVSHSNKEAFIVFLDKLWFDTPWSDSYTCQVVFRVPGAHRKNGLLSTEHLPERRLRETDEPDSSARKRRISHYVVKMLNKVLHRGIFQEQQSEDTRLSLDDRKDREILAIQKAFRLSSESDGVKCHPGWEEHGFVSVMAGQPEEDFEVELDEEEVPILSNPAHAKKMLQVQVEEEYRDPVTRANSVMGHLKAFALDLYRQEILRYISPRVRCNITANEHICNVLLRSCSCHLFIDKGETELCHHLLAALITTRQLGDLEDVLSETAQWYPRIPVPLKTYVNFNRTITLPAYLTNKVECLEGVSRIASEFDLDLASQGQILKVLHSPTSPPTSSKNGSYRTKGGSAVIRKYGVTDLADPYCPNIDFPKSLRGRRSGKGGKKGLKRSLETDAATEAVEEETKKMRVGNSESECQEFGENNVFYVTLPDDTAEELHEVGGSEETREGRDGEGSMYHAKGFPSIVCGRCLDENKASPQLCYSPAELQTHREKEHPEKTLVCAFCYFNNVNVRYSSIKEFNDHLMQEH
ncbi:hypothetical protein GWK47_000764 [Chionoecetes opilio]|uniref:SWIM-type domain-containing protein n=1 Tax=Chionoecetes opilio TaxID=41210 RepID=A0A8J4Y811_CHIOP|nr:hypothetical protein GWK47_000764 [Chionoecetes opilio]